MSSQLLRGPLYSLPFTALVVLAASLAALGRADEPSVEAMLENYCYACHGYGEASGGLALDQLLLQEDSPARREKWLTVLKQLRANLMPPADETQPTQTEAADIGHWIKSAAIQLDSDSPDPGRVTIRRLNRNEYRNTIRDLMGTDFDTLTFFPADDTGHGFDNIGDVLSISPLLFEKYIDAAKTIVARTVPTSGRVKRRQLVAGSTFAVEKPDVEAVEPASSEDSSRSGRRRRGADSLDLSYYEAASARATTELSLAGRYTVELKIRASESYVDNVFDQNRCEFTFSLDGVELVHREFVRQGGKDFVFSFDRELSAGKHELVVEVKPLSSEEQVRRLRIELGSVTFIGPDDPEHFVQPSGYEQFFPRPVPDSADEQRNYAAELIESFASRAYRRPVAAETLEKLCLLAESSRESGDTFEVGIGTAMSAVLASSSFLFREEPPDLISQDRFPLIDEYSLASRLSYLLWSTMPDDELLKLAAAGELRANLSSQIDRMLEHEKSQAFFENFAGQWLQTRAIDSIQINSRAVLRREEPPSSVADPSRDQRRRFFELVRKGEERTEEENKEFEQLRAIVGRSGFRGGPRIELTNDLRNAMRRETEMLFEHIVHENRSLLEVLDCNYIFLNQELAEFYNIPDVEGSQMRKVALSEDSLRGGVLTAGTTLIVTSNPDRTSPVKRGLFVLENMLGVPTAAPPPDIPALEEAGRDDGKPLSLRETLAVHRANAVCSSCHNRMDPLGLALENFNALGRFRENELAEAIDPRGQLVSGETFESIRELKRVLASERKMDFYRCVTEKLMTYALGRTVEYYDVQALDEIVASLESSGGQANSLIRGVVMSAPFHRTRRD